VAADKGLTFEFEETSVDIKGQTFKLKELTTEKYDEAIRAATGADDDIDMVILLRMMLIDSLVEPKLESDDIARLPHSVTRKLTTAVNRLHFPPENKEGNA
jgi:hypothetical protein